MRVYEFAKISGIPSKDLLDRLEKAGFVLSSHMAILTDEALAFLKKSEKPLDVKAKSAAAPKAAVAKASSKSAPKEAPSKSATPKSAGPTEKALGSPLITQKQSDSTSKQLAPAATPKQEMRTPLVKSTNAVNAVEHPRTSAPHIQEPGTFANVEENPEILNALALQNYNEPNPHLGLSKSLKNSLGIQFEGEKRRRRRRRRPPVQHHVQQQAAPVAVTEFSFKGEMPLVDFAEKIGKSASDIIVYFLKKGVVATRNHPLTPEMIHDVARHFNIKAHYESASEIAQANQTPIRAVRDGLAQRAPVVVVMGHVDHGKTSLLDYIRKANVASREKGGITQHLGAYEVNSKHGKIVFIDTPGHEAFTHLRSRGVKVTDIAILVVAADDGIMPQTDEAIQHARSANIPMIVAINKIDKLTSTTPIEAVKNQLAQRDLLTEDWGGSVICLPISAKTGKGVEELLEMISLQAQMMNITADPKAPSKAYILESKLDKGYGPVATVLGVEGTLRVGDCFVAGAATGKVRTLINSAGKRISEAGASIPVQIVGFDKLPSSGEWLTAVTPEEYNKAKASKTEITGSGAAQSAAMDAAIERKEHIVKILLKTDNFGSREAILRSIEKLGKGKKDFAERFHVVYGGVGDISESDIVLAENTGAQVVGFNVKIERNAERMAKDKNVEVIIEHIIYHMTEAFEKLIHKTRKAIMVSTKVGEAVVRKVFDLKEKGVIAGCYVTEGIIPRNAKVVCMRAGRKIGEAKIDSLQRDKKVVKEVHSGYECGFLTDKFHDWQVDDIVQCYVEKAQQPD